MPSSAELVAAINAALKARDMEAVAALLRALAVVDPRSAQSILDLIEIATGRG